MGFIIGLIGKRKIENRKRKSLLRYSAFQAQKRRREHKAETLLQLARE
jgi:hypothetical protein